MKTFDLSTDLEGNTPAPERGTTPLKVELVPATSWGDNLRSRMTKAQWDRIRKNQYRLANHQCELCGQKGTQQGYNWPVECHEVWEYDDIRHTQKLVRLIALCPLCHQVKHFGLTQLRGNRRRAIEHLEWVNGWRRDQAENHVVEAFKVWQRRSQHGWGLDVSYLAEHGIQIEER